ncbi:MAG: 3-deoxy-manno-octulosonate cytidylyltransferase [Smithellaceae bacterium]|nr:3-deoxy-manno-octulosonate cytidylyltransferase [Smithellaceae bacterium]
MKTVAIIPARYQSTRFEGKPLADLAGKPVIQHVYERASRSCAVSLTVVATDDERIRAAVDDFGGSVIMTAPCRRSGTDRIAEAAEILGLAADDIVVNIQGDQPLFEPRQIDEVTAPLKTDPSLEMTTLIYRIRIPEEITHPNAVKVVFDRDNFALYFSRATIPHVRDQEIKTPYYKHHGIYAYRRSFLSVFAALPEGTLEKLEALEQLRALEYGHRIKVIETAFDSLEIDTKEDLRRARDILLRSSSSP